MLSVNIEGLATKANIHLLSLRYIEPQSFAMLLRCREEEAQQFMLAYWTKSLLVA